MRLTATHKMGIAALIMAGSVFLSRLMGLVRDKVVSWQFGAVAESDVYFAAFVVPDFLNYLLAGGYISITLIPLLSKRFEEDEADGWRFFSAVFWWAALGIAALTLRADRLIGGGRRTGAQGERARQGDQHRGFAKLHHGKFSLSVH